MDPRFHSMLHPDPILVLTYSILSLFLSNSSRRTPSFIPRGPQPRGVSSPAPRPRRLESGGASAAGGPGLEGSGNMAVGFRTP